MSRRVAPKEPVLKKPAASSGQGGQVNKLCDQVANAMWTAPEYPDAVKNMLVSTLHGTLAVPKESRHAFQDTTIEMVRKVLDSLKAATQSKLDEAEKKFETTLRENEERQTSIELAAATLAERTKTVDAAKTEHAERTLACVAAKEALASVEREQASGNAGLAVTEERKKRLDSAFDTIYCPLKSGEMPAAEVQDGIKKIEKLGKDFGFDMSLLQTVPAAFAKAPSDRGSFDKVVMSQMEAEFQKRLATFTDDLANGALAKRDRAARVEAASSEHAQALASEEVAKTAREAARMAQKEAETEHKALLKAQQQGTSDLDKASAGVDAAKAELTEFDEGPLAAFKELLEFTEIPPLAAVPGPGEQDLAPAADVGDPAVDVATSAADAADATLA